MNSIRPRNLDCHFLRSLVNLFEMLCFVLNYAYVGVLYGNFVFTAFAENLKGGKCFSFRILKTVLAVCNLAWCGT